MTLIELVLAIVIVGIIVAAVAFFLTPLRQGTDLALRAELTDIADNALQRVGRDVQLALPNSVRTATAGTSRFVEFIAVRTAGRYRAGGGGLAGGTNCPNDDTSLVAPDNDQLSFDLPAGDSCFKTLGKLPGAVVPGSDQLVLNNYGFTDQNAYQTAATLNRVIIAAVDTSEADRDRISFAPTTFVRALHDSPGKRFFVISGPVTYECDLAGRRIYRHSGYALSAAQPTSFVGTPALIAENVIACEFEYTPSVSAQLGLLTLRLQLQRLLFGGGSAETVSLYYAVHVNNAP
ncbi:MAG: type II secretion system protein [Burkholderiales bacterium]